MGLRAPEAKIVCWYATSHALGDGASSSDSLRRRAAGCGRAGGWRRTPERRQRLGMGSRAAALLVRRRADGAARQPCVARRKAAATDARFGDWESHMCAASSQYDVRDRCLSRPWSQKRQKQHMDGRESRKPNGNAAHKPSAAWPAGSVQRGRHQEIAAAVFELLRAEECPCSPCWACRDGVPHTWPSPSPLPASSIPSMTRGCHTIVTSGMPRYRSVPHSRMSGSSE